MKFLFTFICTILVFAVVYGASETHFHMRFKDKACTCAGCDVTKTLGYVDGDRCVFTGGAKSKLSNFVVTSDIITIENTYQETNFAAFVEWFHAFGKFAFLNKTTRFKNVLSYGFNVSDGYVLKNKTDVLSKSDGCYSLRVPEKYRIPHPVQTINTNATTTTYSEYVYYENCQKTIGDDTMILYFDSTKNYDEYTWNFGKYVPSKFAEYMSPSYKFRKINVDPDDYKHVTKSFGKKLCTCNNCDLRDVFGIVHPLYDNVCVATYVNFAERILGGEMFVSLMYHKTIIDIISNYLIENFPHLASHFVQLNVGLDTFSGSDTSDKAAGIFRMLGHADKQVNCVYSSRIFSNIKGSIKSGVQQINFGNYSFTGNYSNSGSGRLIVIQDKDVVYDPVRNMFLCRYANVPRISILPMNVERYGMDIFEWKGEEEGYVFTTTYGKNRTSPAPPTTSTTTPATGCSDSIFRGSWYFTGIICMYVAQTLFVL